MQFDWLLLVAALFGPLVLWILWRGQTLGVTLLRSRLVKLAARRDTKIVYAVVSWFGTFLHEVSHATVLLVSGHGLRQFRAGVETGHVLPARLRHGPIGFMSFLAAALAPMWIPAAVVLVGLAWVQSGTVHWVAAGPGLEQALNLLGLVLVEFPRQLILAMANLDLAFWPHLLLFLVILLAAPAARPSHLKASRFHGAEDQGDVAVLRSRIREHPSIFVGFLLLVYASYFLVLVAPAAYWWPMTALWMVAVTGIAVSLFGAVWWSLAALAARTSAVVAWLGPTAFVAAQILTRIQWPLPIWQINAVALASWGIVALLLRFVLPRR